MCDFQRAHDGITFIEDYLSSLFNPFPSLAHSLTSHSPLLHTSTTLHHLHTPSPPHSPTSTLPHFTLLHLHTLPPHSPTSTHLHTPSPPHSLTLHSSTSTHLHHTPPPPHISTPHRISVLRSQASNLTLMPCYLLAEPSSLNQTPTRRTTPS